MYNARTIDYQVMNESTTPSNIEGQIRYIVEKKGVDGWIRVSKCEKEYVNSSTDENSGTRRTRFYRWLLKVERKKVPDFQVIKFPNNLSYIGLANSSPKKLNAIVVDDKEISQSPSFSDTFYSNAFMKLDEICSMANGHNAHYASPDQALLELISFVATLPRELKEKVKPLQDQALDSVTKHGRITLRPKYKRGEAESLLELERIPDKEFLNDCYYWVLKLVDEVSSLLHESKDNLTLFGLNQADHKSTENPRFHSALFSNP